MVFLGRKYILQLIVKVFYGLLALSLTLCLKISNIDHSWTYHIDQQKLELSACYNIYFLLFYFYKRK